MARSEPRFQVTVELLTVTPSHACLTGFVLHIRTFLEDDNGNVREDDRPGGEFQEDLILPEFMFGCDRHREFVAYCLIAAGWRDEGSLERILDEAFSDAKSILEKEKAKRNQNNNNNRGFNGIPTIILRVKKFLRWEDESEAIMTLSEFPPEEDPKPVPATKESIQALQKVKVEGDGDGAGLECVICMEKLVSSGSEFVTCMPCSHLFHGDCIENWLNTSHLCPLCRFQMPTDGTGIISIGGNIDKLNQNSDKWSYIDYC